MKLCKDCQHLRGELCYSPANGIDPVKGKPKSIFAFSRRISGCGMGAAFFEPKKSFLQRLFK